MSKLANGIFFKRKGEKAPEWVKGKVSIKVDEFLKTIKENENNGWVNLDMLLSKTGSIYFAIDDWKPNQTKPEHPFGKDKTYQAVKSNEPEEDDIVVKKIPF